MNKISIAIIGHGFVGKSVDNGFTKANIRKLIIDPIYNNNVSDLVEFNPECIFVCVPTPMSDTRGIDDSIITNVVKEIKSSGLESLVIIKSTVLPDILEKLLSIYPKIVYNPEFLRERSSDYDFVNPDFLLFGGNEEYCKQSRDIFLSFSDCIIKNCIFTDIKTASFVKYTINSYLALKVIFFNQLKECFDHNSGDTWQKFIDILSLDHRIGSSHMHVPGPDGRKGFGGACFPKDTAAFLDFFEKSDFNFSLLNEAVKSNNLIRSQYKETNLRESDQNIKFT